MLWVGCLFSDALQFERGNQKIWEAKQTQTLQLIFEASFTFFLFKLFVRKMDWWKAKPWTLQCCPVKWREWWAALPLSLKSPGQLWQVNFQKDVEINSVLLLQWLAVLEWFNSEETSSLWSLDPHFNSWRSLVTCHQFSWWIALLSPKWVFINIPSTCWILMINVKPFKY